MKYGWSGQVESGQLRLYINHCDGGELNARSAGYRNYCAENVLRDDSSVYCSKSAECNLLFGHHADTIFHLDKLIIQAPTMGYTAPYVLRSAVGRANVNSVQHGLVFVGMDSKKLLRGSETYRIVYPDSDGSGPDEPDGPRLEIAPRPEPGSAAAPAAPPLPGVSVEYYRLQHGGRRAQQDDDVSREPDSSSEDGSILLADGPDIDADDGEDDDVITRRARRMADILGAMPDPDDLIAAGVIPEGLAGTDAPPLGSASLREAGQPPRYDLDSFLFQHPLFDYMSRRRGQTQSLRGDSPGITVGGTSDALPPVPSLAPPPGAPIAPPSQTRDPEPRREEQSVLGFHAQFFIDKQQSRAIVKFDPPMCVPPPLKPFTDRSTEARDTYC
jgi:hypothetical protein